MYSKRDLYYDSRAWKDMVCYSILLVIACNKLSNELNTCLIKCRYSFSCNNIVS